MATITKKVVVCDRDGKEIKDEEQSLSLTATSTKTGRGRKATQRIDLCEDCSKEFLQFMEPASDG